MLSELVRREDADEGGTTRCYTCGRPIHWKYEAQAGHGIGGRRNAVLLDKEVIRPQCYPCNAKHIGNGRPEIFIPKLIEELGKEKWDAKVTAARLPCKFIRSDLEQMISQIKADLAALSASNP